VKPNASNRRLNSVALALLATSCGQLGTLRFAHQIETAQPFAEHGICDVAGCVQHDRTRSLVCRRGPQRQFEDERRSALARHRSGDTGGVYGLQALSVESAFGACPLISRPKERGTSRFSVATQKSGLSARRTRCPFRRSIHAGFRATTAHGRSARRCTCALQGRSFPPGARRQWDRWEVRRRRTDACLRRYHDAVPGQARDRSSEDNGIGSAAMTCGRPTAQDPSLGQITRSVAHRELVTCCEGWHHQLNPGALRRLEMNGPRRAGVRAAAGW
jgi:hypothetical protein